MHEQVSEQTMTAIKNLVAYLSHDELKDYEQSDGEIKENHIYKSIMVLQDFIKNY
jgi:hypothetical protein